MVDTTKTAIKPRDISYFRQRYRNRVYAALIKFISQSAEERGMSRKDIAEVLGKHPAQVTRWLREPSNLTLDTISDLLLAVEAEPDPPLPIVSFKNRPAPNYAHPLLARVMGVEGRKVATRKDDNVFETRNAGTSGSTANKYEAVVQS